MESLREKFHNYCLENGYEKYKEKYELERYFVLKESESKETLKELDELFDSMTKAHFMKKWVSENMQEPFEKIKKVKIKLSQLKSFKTIKELGKEFDLDNTEFELEYKHTRHSNKTNTFSFIKLRKNGINIPLPFYIQNAIISNYEKILSNN